MEKDTVENKNTYTLSRTFSSACRLNLQHYLWHSNLGYDLHPSISPPNRSLAPSSLSHRREDDDNDGDGTLPQQEQQPQPFRIADVGCGTGIWLTSVATAFPNAELHGYDISLSQAPPLEWLSGDEGGNVTRLREWDVFDEPTPDMCGLYDVVHVRLMFVVVQQRGQEAVALMLRNLMRLLKPGGSLQWDEINVAGTYILEVHNGEADLPEMARTLTVLKQVGGRWVKDLGASMRECGLADVGDWEYNMKKEHAKAFFDNHLAKDVEMVEQTMEIGEERERRLQGIGRLYEESKKGAVLCTPMVVCVGRKT